MIESVEQHMLRLYMKGCTCVPFVWFIQPAVLVLCKSAVLPL